LDGLGRRDRLRACQHLCNRLIGEEGGHGLLLSAIDVPEHSELSVSLLSLFFAKTHIR
jgi:hypothetical protein